MTEAERILTDLYESSDWANAKDAPAAAALTIRWLADAGYDIVKDDPEFREKLLALRDELRNW